jgi:TatD DNase family protein
MNKNSKFKTKKIRKLQIELFKRQVECALRVNLPIVVHSRGAESECFSIISDTIRSGSIDTLFHCYTGSLEVAKEILQAGYYISFNGILTFKNADLVREVFLFAWKNYPELILSETDAPLLAPEPKRGEICEPADVKLVVKKMAEISGVSFEEAAEVTSRNARKFYTL